MQMFLTTSKHCIIHCKCCIKHKKSFVLSAHKAEYGISGFGVSVTTMEEVFIKVGEGANTMEARYVKCIEFCYIFHC